MYISKNVLPLFIIIHYQHNWDNNSKHLKKFRFSIIPTKLDKNLKSNNRIIPTAQKN